VRLRKVHVAKRALVPSPVCVLALGDYRNRSGELGADYLGCAEADLRALADGRMKRLLQVAALTHLTRKRVRALALYLSRFALRGVMMA
jgi:hypothetical protein